MLVDTFRKVNKMITITGKYTNANIMIDNVEPECVSQVVSMINHPAFTNPVAIMPDCHAGKGSVVGFTMPCGDKIVPNCIGVDIGCGMLSFNIGKIDIDHTYLDKAIRERIPFGMEVRKVAHKLSIRYFNYDSLFKRVGIDTNYAINSLGSLGGGNHFIEIGKSVNTGDVWITVHSGSRNLGKKVCEYWQKIAYERIVPDTRALIEEIKRKSKKVDWEYKIKKLKEENKKYKKSDLDWIDGEDKEGYLSDMYFTQRYASVNRIIMMKEILDILNIKSELKAIETIHNFIDKDDNIIRKGAIKSYIGEKMIIPLNMRDGILLCEGKSNPEWNFSAPHGAGRVLSRSKAKEQLILQDYEDKMKGIFTTSVNKFTLDEAPDAYKDSKLIEDAIVPTVNLLDKIIPIHNLKDSEGRNE